VIHYQLKHDPRRNAMVSPVADTSLVTTPARYYQAIWISDLHLGTSCCKADLLLDFLRRHCAETLFLVGDVIDGWNMGPGWCWDAAQTAVVAEIWAWRRRGTKIVFLPGNHDETNTETVRALFGPLECRTQVIHRTAEGRRMLVIHGHQFDGSIHPARWLSMLGSIGYSTAWKINCWYNGDHRHISRRSKANAFLRKQIKNAVHYLIDFDDRQVYEAALRHRVDGVICGHTHRPAYRALDEILYVNDGDWIQSCTALVEEQSGSLRLLRWDHASRSQQLSMSDGEPQ